MKVFVYLVKIMFVFVFDVMLCFKEDLFGKDLVCYGDWELKGIVIDF